MYVLTAPPGAYQLYTRNGDQYTVSSAGTIAVPLADLPDALASGFTLNSSGGSSQFSSQNISGAAGTLTLTTIYTTIFANTSGGAVSFALPAAGTPGRTVAVKDYLGNASTHNITATAPIDGVSSVVMAINYESLTFVDNGTSWSIL